MNFYSLKRIGAAAAFLLATPLLCLPAAVTANGTDELGTGANPGTLTVGQSVSGNFNFLYTFVGNGDQYSILTSYLASNAPVHAEFTVSASYIGNVVNGAVASVGDDTLNVDLLQNFAYTGNSSTTGSASALLTQSDDAAGSFTEAQLYFNNQGTGLMGPYFGPGSQLFSVGPTALTNLGDPVNGDFRYTFFFANGTTPAVPEPSAAGFLALGSILVLGSVRYFRRPRHVV